MPATISSHTVSAQSSDFVKVIRNLFKKFKLPQVFPYRFFFLSSSTAALILCNPGLRKPASGLGLVPVHRGVCVCVCACVCVWEEKRGKRVEIEPDRPPCPLAPCLLPNPPSSSPSFAAVQQPHLWGTGSGRSWSCRYTCHCSGRGCWRTRLYWSHTTPPRSLAN